MNFKGGISGKNKYKVKREDVYLAPGQINKKKSIDSSTMASDNLFQLFKLVGYQQSNRQILKGSSELVCMSQHLQ